MYYLALLMALQDGTAASQSDDGTEDTRACVTVLVPPGSRLYVNGLPSPCAAASDIHAFRTPRIEPGRRYCYSLRVEVPHQDSPLSLCRYVFFRAGERPTVDFRAPSRPSRDPPAKLPIERGTADEGDYPIMPPALPEARPPRQALAALTEKGDVEIASVEFRPVPFTETRKRLVDGKEELYTVTAYRWLAQERTRTVPVKDLRAFSVVGRAIPGRELGRLLRYRTVVALTADGKVDPFYRHTMKEGTLVLAVPEEQAEPAMELELPHAIPGPEEKVRPMPPAAP
jgi:uncharacterized protein (TIGR03000 family)